MAGGLLGRAGPSAPLHVSPRVELQVHGKETESVIIQFLSMVGLSAMEMQHNRKIATHKHAPFMADGQIGGIGLYVQ